MAPTLCRRRREEPVPSFHGHSSPSMSALGKTIGRSPDAVRPGKCPFVLRPRPLLATNRPIVFLLMSCATLDLAASYPLLFVSEKQNDFSNLLQH